MLSVKMAAASMEAGDRETNQRLLRQASQWLQEAEAVVVGIGSGFSTACGFDFYHDTELFQEYFGDFRETYGLKNLFDGFYHLYGTYEEQWGFLSRFYQVFHQFSPGQTYLDLAELLKDKPCQILTTNLDMQIEKVFPQECIWNFQGNLRYLQCSQPCHDKLYEAGPLYERMCGIEEMRAESQELPRCPHCGRLMMIWARDEAFLEGEAWLEGKRRCEEFILENREKKLLFLELGVGDMTPSIIRLPFWEMTEKFPKARMVSISLGRENPPAQIAEKAISVSADLLDAMSQLKEWKISLQMSVLQ